MTEISTIERHFITEDGETFNVIEDESGGIFWGHGHREMNEFVTEVNRWLIHVGADPEWVFSPDDTPVEHLWVAPVDDQWERWTVEEPFGVNSNRWLVPVTRLIA
jgi:hypothetical protein